MCMWIKGLMMALTAFFFASGSKRSKMILAFLYVSVSITSSSWKHRAFKLKKKKNTLQALFFFPLTVKGRKHFPK